MNAQRADRGARPVTAPTDIHDIRVLTATGPIVLPLSPAGDGGLRRA